MSDLTPEMKAKLIAKKKLANKQPKKRPIWKRSEIDESKQYVLLLLENENGLREFEIREKVNRHNEVVGSSCIYATEEIPIEYVLNGNIFGISEAVNLENGESFYFDSLGNWVTQKEHEDFVKDVIRRSAGN